MFALENLLFVPLNVQSWIITATFSAHLLLPHNKSKIFIYFFTLSNVWSGFLWKECKKRSHKRSGTVSSLFFITLSLVLCIWSINSGWNDFLENSCFYYFLSILFPSIVDWLTLRFQWLLWAILWFSFCCVRSTRMPLQSIVFPARGLISFTSVI